MSGVAVESGFTVHADRRLGASPYSPAADWNGRFENEWVLEYTRCDSSAKHSSAGQSLTISIFCSGLIALCLLSAAKIT